MGEAAKTGRLTTHVLDTATGRPAAGLAIDLLRVEGGEPRPLRSVVTNTDGRCDGPLIAGEDMRPGHYELRFHAGDYFRAAPSGVDAFYDIIPIPFVIASATEHYHVPLLLAPFGYSTYRGS